MIAAVVLLLAPALSAALEPSDVFTKTRDCSLSSSDFTKCIKTAIQEIVNNLDNKDVDAEDRMDPMLMPDMPFRYSDRLGITLSEMALHGLSRTLVNGVRYASILCMKAIKLIIFPTVNDLWWFTRDNSNKRLMTDLT
uniref:Uncharacterized protein n=1 Tax=Lygus hesperus TaxID=30085 RepID=A0A146MBL1_LYGHE